MLLRVGCLLQESKDDHSIFWDFPVFPLTGLFWARVPKGTTEVITKVENPTEESAELDIEVNGKNSAGTDVIPSGKTISLRRGISPDTTEVSIKYTGHKGLVILETAFQ